MVIRRDMTSDQYLNSKAECDVCIFRVLLYLELFCLFVYQGSPKTRLALTESSTTARNAQVSPLWTRIEGAFVLVDYSLHAQAELHVQLIKSPALAMSSRHSRLTQEPIFYPQYPFINYEANKVVQCCSLSD